jgi:A/G-specific adenine glycosylase
MEKEAFLAKLRTPKGSRSITEQKFQRVILDFYALHGRTFPWRTTKDSYAIFVSEVMLQQTQTERVVPKYEQFLTLFPSWSSLSKATLAEVLKAWEGLGYYRRARHLHRAAGVVVESHAGETPETIEDLKSLPGVGNYTAAAISAFAYGKCAPMIETNIRAVYLHSFFAGREGVPDSELLPIIERTCFREDPRSWYYGLMDLGVVLKQHVRGINSQSAHYKKQSTFEGSIRQVRAAVLKLLVNSQGARLATLKKQLPREADKIERVLSQLFSEGFIVRERNVYRVL